MDGLNLLLAAVAEGLSVSQDDERLVVRGPKRLEPLALQLLAHKAELLTLLRGRPELAHIDPFTARVLHVFDGELVADGEEPIGTGQSQSEHPRSRAG